MNNSKKKVVRLTLLGFILLLVSGLITGFLGMSDKMNGLRLAIDNFFNLWLYKHFVAYVALVMIFVAVTAFLVLFIIALKKKKAGLFFPILGLSLSIVFLAFIFVLVIPNLETGVLGGRLAILMMCGVTGLTIFAILAFLIPLYELFLDGLNAFKSLAGVKEEKAKKAEEKEAIAGLSEEEVRAIVEKYMQEHLEEKHAEKPVPVAAVAPAQEEPEEEEVEEEEEAEEEEAEEVEKVEPAPAVVAAPADDGAPVGAASKGKRRKASFETRLRNSEFDLRHKYYDLRDYIKWYGLRNRISIPGDSFSYKRQRFAFITIVGKHIRLYINLDPKDYAESTIPVEEATAKKYQDLNSMLRVKSDLSYRRAKKLVDDLMKKIGLEKPEGEEPKETQKPE